MKKFINFVVDTIGSLILMVIMVVLLALSFVIVLPILTIVNSCMNHIPLSESLSELYKTLISKLSED